MVFDDWYKRQATQSIDCVDECLFTAAMDVVTYCQCGYDCNVVVGRRSSDIPNE